MTNEPCLQHCFHYTGQMLTSDPPLYEQVCCNCGEKQSRQLQAPKVREPLGSHGPYCPNRFVHGESLRVRSGDEGSITAGDDGDIGTNLKAEDVGAVVDYLEGGLHFHNPQYYCPVHGDIDNNIINSNVEGYKTKLCALCWVDALKAAGVCEVEQKE